MDEKKLFYVQDGSLQADGRYKSKKTKEEISYIKKSDMEAAFPHGGYKVVGQIGKGESTVGALQVQALEEPVYKTKKQKFTKIVGFVQVGENEFLAVVQSTLWRLLLILLLAALLCVLAGLLIHHFLPEKPNPEPPKKVVVDASAEEGEGKLVIPEKTETKGKSIKVTGTAEIRLKAGQTEQNFVFTNPKGNPCFFEIQLILADTNEVIYTSDLIPPGYSVSNFNLEKPLEAGTYKAVVRYNTYTFDKALRPLNNSVVNTVIVAA